MNLSFAAACKLTGALLMFACVGGGICLRRRCDAERLERLDCLAEFVLFAREQVERYLTPVAEIIRRCDPGLLGGCFCGCPEDARLRRPTDMAGFDGILRRGVYAADGREAFADFAASFGKSYREEELKICEACAGELRKIRERLARELPARRRSRAVMELCCVAAAVIILI